MELTKNRQFLRLESEAEMLARLNSPTITLSAEQCLDSPEIFSPPDYGETTPEREAREAAARLICQNCVDVIPCLMRALELSEAETGDGIWAGYTPEE